MLNKHSRNNTGWRSRQVTSLFFCWNFEYFCREVMEISPDKTGLILCLNMSHWTSIKCHFHYNIHWIYAHLSKHLLEADKRASVLSRCKDKLFSNTHSLTDSCSTVRVSSLIHPSQTPTRWHCLCAAGVYT